MMRHTNAVHQNDLSTTNTDRKLAAFNVTMCSVEPQYAPYTMCSIEEHIVYPTYTTGYHQIGSILCRVCMIPTQYAPWLISFNTNTMY